MFAAARSVDACCCERNTTTGTSSVPTAYSSAAKVAASQTPPALRATTIWPIARVEDSFGWHPAVGGGYNGGERLGVVEARAAARARCRAARPRRRAKRWLPWISCSSARSAGTGRWPAAGRHSAATASAWPAQTPSVSPPFRCIASISGRLWFGDPSVSRVRRARRFAWRKSLGGRRRAKGFLRKFFEALVRGAVPAIIPGPFRAGVPVRTPSEASRLLQLPSRPLPETTS